jgi:hypothetical protein
MDVENYIILDGKKYIWDGSTYDSEPASEDQATNYKRENFEVQVVGQGEIYLVYSRRVVTDVVVEGEAPI